MVIARVMRALPTAETSWHTVSRLHSERGAMERRTLTVDEVALVLGISRGSAFRAVHRNEIRAVRIGRRLLVPRDEVERLLGSAAS